MHDFLSRLYRLFPSSSRLPREDFLTLCLGRQLGRDPALAAALLKRLGLASAVPLRVRSQVRAWVEEGASIVVADLVLDAAEVCVVVEAKVGSAVPSAQYLDSLGNAFPGARIACLVEASAAARVPQGSAVLTWDDVLRALSPGPEGEELRQLLQSSGVGDTRIGLPIDLWARARRLHERYETALLPRLTTCLIALCPQPLQDAVEAALADPDRVVEPSEGWGPGFASTRALPKTGVKGLCLSVDLGEDEELVWKLEVQAGRSLAKALERTGSAWRRVPSSERWFVLELHRSPSGRNLRAEDVKQVVSIGRAALRLAHSGVLGRSWDVRGPGLAPSAPRLSVSELVRGLSAWLPLESALSGCVAEVLHRLLGPTDDGRSPYRWTRQARLSRKGLLPGGQRLRASVDPDLNALLFVFEPITDEHAARVEQAVASWPLPGPAPTWAGGLRVPLSAETWAHPSLVPAIVALLAEILGRPVPEA